MRPTRVLAGLLIGMYFLLLTRGALTAAFSPDDTMNLYRAWSHSLASLARANLLFWETSPFYRPLPAAWYRAIFHFAGFRPLLFHLSGLAILGVNIFLTYAVARRISGSREAGATAALLGCYHPNFAPLYFDTGFIYDVLCYFFYFAALLLYLRIRQGGEAPRAAQLAALAGLYICALNSKEIAVTLPLFLAIYECLWHPPRGFDFKQLRRWVLHQGRAAMLTGVITLVFLIGRTAGAESMERIAAYQPVFTWRQFMQSSVHFLDDLFLLSNRFTAAAALILWIAMLAIAWKTRSRTLWFAWLFLILATAPVVFLSSREAPQYYVPLFGWVLYAATGITRLVRRPAVVFAAFLLLLFPFYQWKGWSKVYSVRVEGPVLQDMAAQLHRLHPRLEPGARLFFLNDPVEPDWQNLTFVARLSYADDTLEVGRARMLKRRPSDAELAGYHHVFDYRGGRFVELYRPWQWKPAPQVILKAGMPQLFHTDWAVVTAGQPARPGEMLIARLIELGATSSATPPGRPFPAEPRARVIAPITMSVNGRRTEPVEVFGWPGEADIFRLDFRVPEETAAGAARLEIAADGVTGLPVDFPVR